MSTPRDACCAASAASRLNELPLPSHAWILAVRAAITAAEPGPATVSAARLPNSGLELFELRRAAGLLAENAEGWERPLSKRSVGGTVPTGGTILRGCGSPSLQWPSLQLPSLLWPSLALSYKLAVSESTSLTSMCSAACFFARRSFFALRESVGRC